MLKNTMREMCEQCHTFRHTSSACLQSHHSLFIRFILILVFIFPCTNITTTTTAKMWIKIHFNTYPNQRLHFVRLCWRSINQLSSIERFALTIWVWRAGVFQQISLSSLFMCVSGASVESTSKKRDAIECQLIHRRNWWNLLSLSLWQLMMNALLTK